MMKKRVISLVLASVMVAGMLTGCGNAQEAAESTGTSKEAGTVASQDATNGGTPEYEVATVRWADWGEFYHEGFPDNAAAEAGINVKWNTILNADWGDQKAVLLAGGDLPDAFMGSICFSESDIMSNQGTFIALDEYIDEYMPNLKAIMESDPTMKALATSSDGHIYGLPAKKPCRPTVANQLFINKTWLDNLGLEVPTTYEEFVDVLRAFRDQDANGNGDASDEIPYGQGYADSVMFYCLPYGTTIGADGTYLMTVKDAAPVFIPTADFYKEAIEWMHDCYEEGLIDPEMFTQDTSMRDAKLMAETPVVGVAPGWTADATFGANASQYVALPALTGPDGNQYISSDPEHWNYSRYEFVVTSNCEDPGKLLAWADKFYTEDASIETFYGTVGVEKSGDTYTVLEPNDGNSADTFAWINSLRDFGPKYVAEGFNDKVVYAGANGDASKLELDKEMKQFAGEAYPNVSFTPDQVDVLATLWSDINSYVTTTQATWVTEGGATEQWETYLSTLEQMGYDEFIGIMNDAYNTYMGN